jgi:hypothetical protein
MSIRQSRLSFRGCLALGLLAAAPLHAADLEIVSEGGIGRDWAAAPGSSFAAPGYPADMLERRAHVCLNIAYTLRQDGVPSDLELLKSWSRDAANVPLSDGELERFVQSAATALMQWRFVPKQSGKRVKLTRTAATLVFRGSGSLTNVEVAATCKVSDLAAFIETGDGEAARQRTVRQIMQRTELQHQRDRQAQLMAEQARRRAALQEE